MLTPEKPLASPDENYFRIARLATEHVALMPHLTRDALEESVKAACWRTFGAKGYTHAVVQRAVAAALAARAAAGHGQP